LKSKTRISQEKKKKWPRGKEKREFVSGSGKKKKGGNSRLSRSNVPFWWDKGKIKAIREEGKREEGYWKRQVKTVDVN